MSKDKDKAVSVLNEAPCYRDAWGSEGTAPRILNLGTRLK